MTAVEASTLADALKTCAPALPRASFGNPVMTGVRLTASEDRLRVECTNLDVTIATRVPCKPGDDLDVVVPARLLRSFVERLGDAVTLRADDAELHLSAGTAQVSLRTLRADEWPKIPEVVGEPVKISADTLGLIGRILPSIDPAHTKPDMRTVRFEDGAIVGTDGYRLARAEVDHQLPDMLAPVEAMPAIVEHGRDGAVYASDGRLAVFETGPTRTTLRLVPGSAIAWKNLIPKTTPHHLTVDRQALLDALALLAPVGANLKKDRLHVRVVRDGDAVTLTSSAIDLGEAIVRVEADADFDFVLGVDVGYLRTLAEQVTADELRIDLVDALKPMVAVDGPLLQLLMPKRLPS